MIDNSTLHIFHTRHPQFWHASKCTKKLRLKILFLSLLLWWYCTIFWKDGSFSSSKLVITFLRDLIFSNLSCTFTHVHTYIHISECNLYFMHEQSSTIFHIIIFQNQNQNFLYILYVYDYNEEREDAHVLLRLICIFLLLLRFIENHFI